MTRLLLLRMLLASALVFGLAPAMARIGRADQVVRVVAIHAPSASHQEGPIVPLRHEDSAIGWGDADLNHGKDAALHSPVRRADEAMTTDPKRRLRPRHQSLLASAPLITLRI